MYSQDINSLETLTTTKTENAILFVQERLLITFEKMASVKEVEAGLKKRWGEGGAVVQTIFLER